MIFYDYLFNSLSCFTNVQIFCQSNGRLKILLGFRISLDNKEIHSFIIIYIIIIFIIIHLFIIIIHNKGSIHSIDFH